LASRVTLNKCGVDIVTKEIGTKQIPPIKELKMFLSKYGSVFRTRDFSV